MPMRTQAARTTPPLTGSHNDTKRAPSFLSGLLLGLSAPGLLLGGGLPRPEQPSAGLDADWRAVGQDLAAALGKHGQ